VGYYPGDMSGECIQGEMSYTRAGRPARSGLVRGNVTDNRAIKDRAVAQAASQLQLLPLLLLAVYRRSLRLRLIVTATRITQPDRSTSYVMFTP